MQLFNFLKKRTKKAKPKQHFFALILAQDYIEAALWSPGDGTVEIASQKTILYQGDWNERIVAADGALSQITEAVSSKEDINRVVFGLLSDYVKGEKIIPEYLAGLRRLTKELSLTPAGYVVIPEAIAYLLAKQESSPLSAILVGVAKTSLAVSIFKVGKTIGMLTLPRSAAIVKDLEEALSRFTDVEVMPSKILLYDGEKIVATARQELLSHSWQRNPLFLHFPKIDLLRPGIVTQAVVVAAASDIYAYQETMAVIDEGKGGLRQSVDRKPADQKKEVEEVKIDESRKSHIEQKQLTDAANLGFAQDIDVAKFQPIKEGKEKETIQPRMEVVVEQESKRSLFSFFRKPKLVLPQLSLPSFNFNWRANLGPIFIFLAIAIFFGGSVMVSIYWTYPAATMTLLVDSQEISRQLEVIIDPSISKVEESQTRIPGKKIEAKVEGTKKVTTSGKKTIGEPARGEVTIYNKTTKEATFPKGTVLFGPKSLSFTLDDSLSVASVSDIIVGTPGKKLAKITASSIGSQSNLPAGSDFSFKDFPLTLYAARNEQALSQGSSREVKAVSKDDQERLRSLLGDELSGQAKRQILEKLTTGEQLVDESIDLIFSNMDFSHNVGEAAEEFSLQATANIKGIAYQDTDIISMVEKKFSDAIPENFTLSQKEMKLKVVEAKVNDEGVVQATFKVSAWLLPKIVVDKVKKELVGKTLADVEKHLREVNGVVGYEVSFTKKLPFTPRRLPNLSANLIIKIEPR